MTIDVRVDDGFETSIANGTEAFVIQLVAKVLQCLDLSSKSISVVVSGDELLTQLNNEYLGKNSPTNVLSFPFDEDDGSYLGDIAVSVDTIITESAEYNIELEEHFAHMILHGILHLVGYDHEELAEADEMEQMESKVMVSIGYSDPHYVSRVT